MTAAVGGVALARDESVGFERVEQRHEHARGHVHDLDESRPKEKRSRPLCASDADVGLLQLPVPVGLTGPARR